MKHFSSFRFRFGFKIKKYCTLWWGIIKNPCIHHLKFILLFRRVARDNHNGRSTVNVRRKLIMIAKHSILPIPLISLSSTERSYLLSSHQCVCWMIISPVVTLVCLYWICRLVRVNHIFLIKVKFEQSKCKQFFRWREENGFFQSTLSDDHCWSAWRPEP